MPLQPSAEQGSAPDTLGGPPAPEYVATDSGLLHSTVAGRTDHLKVKTPSGAYVIPADVVSGIGEGNTLAGARILQAMFSHGGPYGGAVPPGQRARGGATESAPAVPFLGAGGEYIVAPQHVKEVGGGDLNKGHRILDAWVVRERKAIAKTMLKLPGPVKD